MEALIRRPRGVSVVVTRATNNRPKTPERRRRLLQHQFDASVLARPSSLALLATGAKEATHCPSAFQQQRHGPWPRRQPPPQPVDATRRGCCRTHPHAVGVPHHMQLAPGSAAGRPPIWSSEGLDSGLISALPVSEIDAVDGHLAWVVGDFPISEALPPPCFCCMVLVSTSTAM